MHRARATIDLGAIRRNVRTLSSRLHPGSRFMGVVKADGYGHGMLHVAAAVLEAGSSGLAVATADEAWQLRNAGFGGTILIMGPIAGHEIDEVVGTGAEVVVWSPQFVEAISEAARRARVGVNLHVKVDTGMHRLGIAPARLARLAEAITFDPWLSLKAVMTHFATADDDADFMEEQLSVFERAVAPLREGLPSVRYHAANSAATLRNPRSHLDMVRCGIAVYGMSPFQWDPARDELEPTLTLTSYVAAVRDIMPGEGVSYSLTWRAPKATRVALVPTGYGDGFFRSLSNRGDVLIRGRRYPRVGNVCMDQFLVEVGRDSAVRFGDEVVLIGRQGNERITAEELAAHAGTINYEITCSLTPRVRREYVGGSLPEQLEGYG